MTPDEFDDLMGLLTIQTAEMRDLGDAYETLRMARRKTFDEAWNHFCRSGRGGMTQFQDLLDRRVDQYKASVPSSTLEGS